MQKTDKVSIIWFRRDLRLEDNKALFFAQQSGFPVLPIFIFDNNIILELDANDGRISFIYNNLKAIHSTLADYNSALYCLKGKPIEVWKQLINEFEIASVFANKDYEPYAIQRDKEIGELLSQNNIPLNLYKDQVIFEENEVLKSNNEPYTVFTPYKNCWLSEFINADLKDYSNAKKSNFFKFRKDLPSLNSLSFKYSDIQIKPYNIDKLNDYELYRNIPSVDGTSNLSPHLRFGTISIRRIVNKVKHNEPFLNELIWREFFMQILFHFPKVINKNFKSKYDNILWRNNKEEFDKWCIGATGYPIVDAGMRELNATGYMHNRVRMITAGFLCKHLLIDWRWGETYFAKKLLDFELSSNNGNWQWAAGTGCDSAPYFRIFNPSEQLKKFDKQLIYINKWIPELNSHEYPLPMVEHDFARKRALERYKEGLKI
ncbi:MAG: deoxyribodipyrimidine photolyase [Bacteroidetes bacterium CG2_30_33_31]|nr:MAG: deoxyribodipyrimidine photolyase [Bacteroidetes bacterium CG2_30_33_31]